MILDYVPNHTSNESEWFVKSAKREPHFENYYVWADGVKDANNQVGPPSNWVHLFKFVISFIGNKNEEKQLTQYYLKECLSFGSLHFYCE